MPKKCDLTGKQSMTGNNVSHANNKTKRKFFPNLQSVSLYSDQLESKLSFKVAAFTLRTIEKSGVIDKFLLNSNTDNLSNLAKKYKKNIIRKLEAKKVKTSQ